VQVYNENAHAYLVSGGSKKQRELFAEEFTKAIFGSSQNAAAGHIPFSSTNPDILIVRQGEGAFALKQAISIKEIKEVVQPFVKKTPYSAGGKKLIIIFDAEKMQSEAQNTFLKTLEEPTPTTVILILASDDKKMLQTIRSRCLKQTLAMKKPVFNDDIYDAAKLIVSRTLKKKPSFGSFSLLDSVLNIPEKGKKAINYDKKKTSEFLDAMECFLRDVIAGKNLPSELLFNSENEKIAKETGEVFTKKMQKFLPRISETKKYISSGYNPKQMMRRLILAISEVS
jgi:DNA polymerase-3 subunit delta'